MVDTMTKKQLRVTTDRVAGPYMWVPFSQLDEIRQVLTSHNLRHWTGENAISMDGAPEVIIIKFGRDGDANAIQAALDSVP